MPQRASRFRFVPHGSVTASARPRVVDANDRIGELLPAFTEELGVPTRR